MQKRKARARVPIKFYIVMKPKNRYFCVGCQRPKMLFETKSKADNFLKFNEKDFDKSAKGAPVRSYFCSFCGGWHISSISSITSIISAKERDGLVLQSLIGPISEEIQDHNSIEYKEFIEQYGYLSSLYSQIRIIIASTDYDSAKRLLEKAQIQFQKMLRHNLSCCINDERQSSIENAFAQLSSFLQLLIELQNKPHIPPDETLGIMFQNHQSGYCRKAINNLKNKIIFLRIISALHQCEKEDERNILILQAESIVKSGFRGGGCSNLRKWAKALLNGYA